jgi:2-phospho-L-lactate/phosphoenolpyruvate guanylyltransferase
MTIWAIVPVKPLRRGKSRLAGKLTEDQRTRLNRYLLKHILDTLNEAQEIDHTLVVSHDPAALALTRDMGGRTVLENGTPQFNIALKRATAVARMNGAHAVLILPADLPLITADNIHELLELGKDPPVVVIAPDRRKNGTNGLLVNPAGIIEYGYGPGSNFKHAENATINGARVEFYYSDKIGLDLDLPEDLELVGGLKGLHLE